jgi:hypothetical protein
VQPGAADAVCGGEQVVKVPCPVSPHHYTSQFSTYQDLWCHDCRKFHPWPLKDDQAPLITSNRDKRKK